MVSMVSEWHAGPHAGRAVPQEVWAVRDEERTMLRITWIDGANTTGAELSGRSHPLSASRVVRNDHELTTKGFRKA